MAHKHPGQSPSRLLTSFLGHGLATVFGVPVEMARNIPLIRALLFGLTEGTADLAAGASPVLVEGPMDAVAVTLASRGEYVGIAPLGVSCRPTPQCAIPGW